MMFLFLNADLFKLCIYSAAPGLSFGMWNLSVAQSVKNLPALQETQVWSPGQVDPLEKGMASHSNILAWRIPWTEESGGP